MHTHTHTCTHLLAQEALHGVGSVQAVEAVGPDSGGLLPADVAVLAQVEAVPLSEVDELRQESLRQDELDVAVGRLDGLVVVVVHENSTIGLGADTLNTTRFQFFKPFKSQHACGCQG